MKKFIRRLYSVIVYTFLYAPIAVMIVYSFNESKYHNKWGGFSLKWYAQLFKNDEILRALKNTLYVAVIASLVSAIIGTLAAWGIHNLKSRRAEKAIMNVTYLPMLNPDIVTGVSMMILFIFVRIPRGFVTMTLAHISFCVPYVILSLMPKLNQLGKSIYEAALDLGCRPAKAFFKIVLPDILPGLATGVLLAFTLSIDDFVISFFTTGPGVSNLSIVIYSMTKKGINPTINALSTLMFFTVLLLLIIVNVRLGDKNKKNKNNPERIVMP